MGEQKPEMDNKSHRNKLKKELTRNHIQFSEKREKGYCILTIKQHDKINRKNENVSTCF